MHISTLSRHFYGSAPLCLLALLSLFGQAHAASGAATEIVSASSGKALSPSNLSAFRTAFFECVLMMNCPPAAEHRSARKTAGPSMIFASTVIVVRSVP